MIHFQRFEPGWLPGVSGKPAPLLYLDGSTRRHLDALPNDAYAKALGCLQMLRTQVRDLSAKLGIQPPIITLSNEQELRKFALLRPINEAMAHYNLTFDPPPNTNTALSMHIGFIPGLEELALQHAARPLLQFTQAELRAVIAHELGHALPEAPYLYQIPRYSPPMPTGLWSERPDNAPLRAKVILNNHLGEFFADSAVIRAGESADALISSMLKSVRHDREGWYDLVRLFPGDASKAYCLRQRREINQSFAEGSDSHPDIYTRAALVRTSPKDDATWQEKLDEARHHAETIERKSR